MFNLMTRVCSFNVGPKKFNAKDTRTKCVWALKFDIF